MTSPGLPARPRGFSPAISVLGVPLLALLAVEFLLGMALNLLVTIPSGSPATILATSPWLDVHIAVGVMLLGLLARVLTLGTRQKDRSALLAGALGLVSGVGAFVAGLSFAFGGGSPNASYVMSVGFAGLLVSAGILLRPRLFGRATPGAGASADAPGSGSTGAP